MWQKINQSDGFSQNKITLQNILIQLYRKLQQIQQNIWNRYGILVVCKYRSRIKGFEDKAKNSVNAKYSNNINLINVQVFLCNKMGLGLLDRGLQ
jgi:hypothetical protein